VNHMERTAAALEEINPPVAEAVRRAGPNRSGQALPGLLTWLPARDLVDLAKACWLADAEPAVRYGYASAVEMALDLQEWPGPIWRPSTEAQVTEAVIAWSRRSGRIPLLDLMAVVAGEALN
jgi:hypothetical protein